MSCCSCIKASERTIVMNSVSASIDVLPVIGDDCSAFTLSPVCSLRMAP